MRHYAHHIGDYISATAHLSFIEDAAYRRLLDRYYQDEKPLPPDLQLVCKLVRAVSRHEKDAVRRVLNEFFTFTPEEGWKQCRADTEISKYKSLANHGRLNGLKGGRPKANHEETATTNQEPLTKNHSIPRQARKTKLPDDWQPSEELLAYAAEQGCIDPLDTSEKFRLHHQSKGTLAVNWNKGFQFWCRNQKTFTQANGPRPNGYSQPPQATTIVDDSNQWAARLRGYTAGGFWSGNWGPRPEDGGSHIPPPILAAWRASA